MRLAKSLLCLLLIMIFLPLRFVEDPHWLRLQRVYGFLFLYVKLFRRYVCVG